MVRSKESCAWARVWGGGGWEGGAVSLGLGLRLLPRQLLPPNNRASVCLALSTAAEGEAVMNPHCRFCPNPCHLFGPFQARLSPSPALAGAGSDLLPLGPRPLSCPWCPDLICIECDGSGNGRKACSMSLRLCCPATSAGPAPTACVEGGPRQA